MNEANKTNESGKETAQNVHSAISPPQLNQYLQNLDQRIEEERKKEIHEQFRNIRCFQNILGTSTSFKLIDNRSFFGKCDITIHPQNVGGLPIKLYPNSTPKIWAMSLYNEREPAFLSYVSHKDITTVFCPEVQQPLGRIVRRKAVGEADIFCLANGQIFIVKNMEIDTMSITDAHGRLVGTASVSQREESLNYTTTTCLKQFILRLENSLSEPTKVMLFVCFANWAKWSNDEVNKKNRNKKLILIYVILKVILLIALIITLTNKDE